MLVAVPPGEWVAVVGDGGGNETAVSGVAGEERGGGRGVDTAGDC